MCLNAHCRVYISRLRAEENYPARWESQALLGSEAAQSHQTAGGHDALMESSQQCRPVVGVEIPTPGALQQGIDSLHQL